MTAELRLFWIEARRSFAIWFVPVVLALTIYVGRRPYASDIALWSKTSAQVGQALLVLVPLTGGLATWIAGRDRRRGIEDLLASTPKPAVRRDLVGFAASAGWTLLAYVFAVAVVFLIAWRPATWGSPDLLPVGTAMASITFAAAVGIAAGLSVPSRFSPPLVAIALLAALIAPTGGARRNVEVAEDVFVSYQSPVGNLTPLTYVDPRDYDPFYDIWPDIALPLMAWLSALAGIAIAVIVLRRGSRLGWPVLIFSMLIATLAGTGLYRTPPQGPRLSQPSNAELVCQSARITVCLHPAYEALLDDAADLVLDLTEPVAGLPGVPVRVEQDPLLYEGTPVQAGVVRIHFYNWIYGGSYGRSNDAAMFVGQILCQSECGSIADSGYWFGDPVREVVGSWLLTQAGIELDPLQLIPEAEGAHEVSASIQHFEALPTETRRRWFEEHFADLRAGRLTLVDLP